MNILYRSVVFSGGSEKQYWYDTFDSSYKITQWNSMKLDQEEYLNVLYQDCVFRVDRKKKQNKVVNPASDVLRYFRLVKINRLTDFNDTWNEERSQRPLPRLWIFGWSEIQDSYRGLWLAETYSTSPLKPLNIDQQSLTGSKTATFSEKFVFFGLIRKPRCPPWPICNRRWHIVIRCTIVGSFCPLLFLCWEIFTTKTT